VDHAVVLRDLHVAVGDQRERNLDAEVSLDAREPADVRVDAVDGESEQLDVALVELGQSFENATNSVVHTGVKSAGCEKSTTHFRPR